MDEAIIIPVIEDEDYITFEGTLETHPLCLFSYQWKTKEGGT